MPFVLDNSVVCGWLLGKQATEYTAAIARQLQHDRAIAPPLLRLQYANVLRTACKRQTLIAADAQKAIRLLGNLPIETDDQKPDAAQLLALALRYDLTAYDATYLELALRKQLPIATQDAELAQAAQIAGVGVVAA